LKWLYDYDVLGPIRRNVAASMPYIGSSAGSIVACPTLKTTKDMPVVQPPCFEALGLVSFQISPHIVFDSTGMALQDVAAAALLYEKAERQGPVFGLALQPNSVIAENYRIHFCFTRLKH
jgi:dipeptidase E